MEGVSQQPSAAATQDDRSLNPEQSPEGVKQHQDQHSLLEVHVSDQRPAESPDGSLGGPDPVQDRVQDEQIRGERVLQLRHTFVSLSAQIWMIHRNDGKHQI